jgi:phospholipid/cholesterol/gamma-HCH transport system substrate-binding protein
MNPQRQLLLGIFFILALSILAFYTLFLTDIHLFSQPILMRVYFPEANNLREGDPVQLLGARIGRVKEVTPNITAESRKRILTVLSLDREVELVEGASISIRETSLLGGRNVFIDPGTFGGPKMVPLEDGAFFGEVYKNPIASLGDIGKLLNENREAITGFLTNLDAITDDLRAGKGLLGQLIENEQMAGEGKEVVSTFRDFATNARDVTQQLKSGQGLLGSLLYEEAAKQKFTDTLDNLRQVTSDLKGQQGILGALIYDTALKDKLGSAIDSFGSFVAKLNESEGALQLLLSDPTTREELRSLVSNLSKTSADIETVVAQVKSGQGTIGKLVMEDTLYQDFRKTVGVLTRSLEDYREAAPITSFTSVLFAAF